jgi:DNA-binding NarL/FixJ family response regulator
VRTILLAATVEKAQILRALQLGARGVVQKESATQLLFKCIRSVMAGQFWVGRESVTDLVQYLQSLAASGGGGPAADYDLTPREQEILMAIVAGYTNKDIAQKLSISVETVKHHLTNIFDKLGVSNRLELALFAIERKLIKSP